MLISVVIPTWNRAELLRRTLESVRALRVPPGQPWEVVVVNNNSTDATDQVLDGFAGSLPLRRVFEPRIGVSWARIAGVAAASGELLLFTDDDVQVDPDWMVAYLDAAGAWPDAGYFAGEVRPQLAADVPRWVRRHQGTLTGMLCARGGDAVCRPLRPREYPFGSNMAIRRATFALGAFDGRVGRIGHGQMRGSEDSLFRAVERRGVSGVWVPAATVSHHVPRARATIAYLWRYYQGSGRGTARLDYPGGPSVRDQAAATRDAVRGLLAHPREWPRRLAYVAWHSGRLLESRRLTRGDRRGDEWKTQSPPEGA